MRKIGLGLISAALIVSFSSTAIAGGPDSVTVRRYGVMHRVTLWQNNGLADLLEQVRKEEYDREHDSSQKIPTANAEPKEQEAPQR